MSLPSAVWIEIYSVTFEKEHAVGVFFLLVCFLRLAAGDYLCLSYVAGLISALSIVFFGL